ncbi:uncharacterized protein TNCT_554551 [Trichonephila clavata]|uniref:Uncharacterized protein n=1 Tax=Trichonephila clavata TaxID=2740835 RepID=A0A8X6JA16_TRICU|nr:uncharacterized protein TNCT_554551 [Trichonephila clavata]
MKRRAESLNVNDKLMTELFLQRLPSSVQTILAAVSDLTLDKAADIADRIFEVSPSPIETFSVSKEQSLESKLFREIEKLNQRIDRLSIFVVALHTVGTKIPVKETFRISVIFRFAGFTGVLGKKCRDENALNHAYGRETKPAKNNGDLFFAQGITSPVHSRPDNKYLLSGRPVLTCL